MLDTTKEIAIPKMRTTEGWKEIAMRWPTDAEWAQWTRGRSILRRDLGQGKSTVEPEIGQSDLQLYNAAKTLDSPELTAGEATLFIQLVAACEAIDIEMGAMDAVVTLRVANADEVKHTLRIPTAEQLLKAQKLGSRTVSLPHNLWASRVNQSVWLQLWQDCQGRSEDYAGEIPAIHREAAIREVAQAMQREMMPGQDENPI